jgi:ribonuclease HI
MELQAAIAALDALALLKRGSEKVTLYTDSQYLQKGMTSWLSGWKAKGWCTSDRQPVKNQDLWEQLDARARDFSIAWTWVKGHDGNQYNERCDALTQQAIASLRNG